MIQRLFGLVLLFVVPIAVYAAPDAPRAIVGFWQTDEGGAIVRIEPNDQRFIGRIVWLKQDRYRPDDPQGMGGQPIIDRHNPDPALRDRPVVGLRMIKKLDYHVLDNGRARWEDGRVYDPDRGKWFDCYLWLADENHLKLHGYIGVSILGRTTTWTRVADPRR